MSKFFVDFPDPHVAGGFISDDMSFDTREEAEEFCKQWGAEKGKIDLISEIEVDEEDEEETE